MSQTAFMTVILLILPGSASQAQKIAAGVGTKICSQFLTDLASDRTPGNSYFDWAQGYMTGLNELYSPGQKADLLIEQPNSLPVDAQISYLHNFCSNYPTERYYRGVQQLYRLIRHTQGLD
jgi:hypothetical protein